MPGIVFSAFSTHSRRCSTAAEPTWSTRYGPVAVDHEPRNTVGLGVEEAAGVGVDVQGLPVGESFLDTGGEPGLVYRDVAAVGEAEGYFALRVIEGVPEKLISSVNYAYHVARLPGGFGDVGAVDPGVTRPCPSRPPAFKNSFSHLVALRSSCKLRYPDACQVLVASSRYTHYTLEGSGLEGRRLWRVRLENGLR